MKTSIAGIGVGSGRKESFYFCVLEYFTQEKRWFLKTCQQLREFDYPKTEDSLLAWIEDFKLSSIVVDFPLSMPPCSTCDLVCPGSIKCEVSEVIAQRDKIETQLKIDEEAISNNPKKYEQDRLENSPHILSKSLKRKLKKGFIPYWNRLLDVDLSLNYHDDLMTFFKRGYNSIGSGNSNQVLRFQYLEKHLPSELNVFESDYTLNLIELYRAKILEAKDLRALQAFHSSAESRVEILRKIEKKCNLFLYEKDREALYQKPRAFQSFILALAGIYTLSNKSKNKSFFVSDFSYL